jgi:hypothetical protein
VDNKVSGDNVSHGAIFGGSGQSAANRQQKTPREAGFLVIEGVQQRYAATSG